MDKFLENLQEASKIISTVDHMLYVTFPQIKAYLRAFPWPDSLHLHVEGSACFIVYGEVRAFLPMLFVFHSKASNLAQQASYFEFKEDVFEFFFGLGILLSVPDLLSNLVLVPFHEGLKSLR